MGGMMARPGELMARRFARTVARSSDERLRRLASGRRRRLVIGTIFRQMPKRLDREQAKDVETVVDWKIGGRPDGGVDHYQVTIAGGRCSVIRNPSAQPRATLELDGVDFMRLVTGAAQGPELFMSGRLRIDGDLMLTARLPALFRVPAG